MVQRRPNLAIHKHPFLHPFLLAAYPILALIAHNMAEIQLTDGIRSIFFSQAGVVVILFALFLFLKERGKAALITSLVAVIFFSYGHVYLYLEGANLFGLLLGRHRYLLPVYMVIFGIMTWIILRSRILSKSVTPPLNAIAVILFLIPVLQITYVQVSNAIASLENPPANTDSLTIPDEVVPPDIYYVILDGYPRDDVLKTTFGYDNSKLLNFLTQRGFYIARCSQSNYSLTRPSLASSLNMTYMDGGTGDGTIAFGESALDDMIQNSTVQALVEGLGYTTVTFETGYKWLGWSEADFTLSAFSTSSDRFRLLTGLNDFELLVMRTSAALLLFDIQVSSQENQTIDFYALLAASPRSVHRERILFNFDQLKRIPAAIQGPKFVYAHITSPHPPYIFGPNGERIFNEPTDQIEGYRDQVNYLNTLLMEAVDVIINQSDIPAVIVIQGDHGAVIDYDADSGLDLKEKLAILNAYNIPGIDSSQFYPSISPVNTFRLIFSHVFGGNYEMLEDRSFLKNVKTQLPCDPNG